MKILGEENGNPLQYSCLENLMNRGAWQATVQGVARVGHDLATKPPHEDQPISIHITLNSLQNSKNPNPRNPKSIWM